MKFTNPVPVAEVIARIERRPSGDGIGHGTGFLGELRVSNGTASQAFGPVTATIFQHGVGTTNREVRIRTTTVNFSDVEVNVVTPLTGTCATAEPVPFVTPRVVHWFDNPFFAGRRYDDTIYGCTSNGTLGAPAKRALGILVQLSR